MCGEVQLDAPGPWSGGGEAKVRAGCVEGDAELARVAAHLGEEEAALEAGHGGGGERGGVRVCPQLAPGLHAGEALAQVRFPPLEAGGDGRSGAGVLFGELADEAADRAATSCLPFDLMLDV